MSRTYNVQIQERLVKIENDLINGVKPPLIAKKYSEEYGISERQIFTNISTVKQHLIAQSKRKQEDVRAEAIARKEDLYHKSLKYDSVNAVKTANDIDNDRLRLHGLLLDKDTNTPNNFSPVQVVFNVASEKEIPEVVEIEPENESN